MAYDPTTNTVVTNDYKSGNLLFFTYGQTAPSRTLNFDGAQVDPIFTFDSSGNLAVADQTHLKIYPSGSSTPAFTTNVNSPQALAFDSSDNLALTNGATVQVFAPGATTPTYTVGGFGNPIAVAFVPQACNPALGVCEAAINCGAILSANPTAQSGVYWIQPAGTEAPQQVYCDMSSDGGGWTLVANEVVGDDPGYVAWSSTSGYRPASTNYLAQTWRMSDANLNAVRNQGVYRLTGNVAFGHRFAMSSCVWSSATLNPNCNATYSDLDWDGAQMEGPVDATGAGGQNGTCYDFGGITDYYEPNCTLGNADAYSFLRTSNEGTGGQGFDIWVTCGDTACSAPTGTANQVWVR